MCRSPHPLRQSPFRRQTERCSADTAYEEVDALQIGAGLEEAERASRDAENASGEGQATWPPLPIAETAEASAEALYGQRTDASAEPLSETLEPPENDRQRVAGSETARPSSAFEALMEGLQPAAAAVQQEASQTSAEELMAIFVELKTNSKKRAPWWIERGCPDPDPEDPSVVITEALSKFRAATLKASFDERQRFLKLSASEEPQRVEDHPSRAA